MTAIGIPPRPSGEWDVPPQQVADEAVLCESLARHAALGNEQEAIADAEALRVVRHPELCRTESGDPAWDAWLAARTVEMAAAWDAAHTKQPRRAS